MRGEAFAEQLGVLAMHPGIELPRIAVGRNLAPERRPERTLLEARFVERQRFGQDGE
jgi:hypothetical protein